ncbi:anti-sigma factor RsbA family regulatory protein [Nocardia sp. NPDC057668]|uniref:anti-sigma factor RsbA family regulatory protein n=1 Tax=Nocardia sp. NPDC057668 TaxID=3346202 RepID=UPI00366FEA9F
MTYSHGHPAYFYRTDRQYLDGIVPFLTESQDPVAAAVPPARLELLRTVVDPAAVTLIDMSVAGRNPGRIIPGVMRAFADKHPDRHVRIVGEPIWAGRTAFEYPACAQHEALINLAFAGRAVTILCPYDVSALDAIAIADARQNHPEIWEPERRYTSECYDPKAVIDRYNQPLPCPGSAPDMIVSGPGDVGAARHLAAEKAALLGLSPERIPDLELIATELVTNGIAHGDSPCHLWLYRDERSLICQTRDGGYIADPLAGRHPPQRGQFGGRGLLLVHQLCDLFRTHTTPGQTTQYAVLDLAG